MNDNKNEPLVSVLVPMYNVEKYLAKCLDSIISQTYRNLEIIIVDDKSPDNSIAIARDYAKQDQRIKIIRHETNQRFGGARNTGLDNAAGEFIVFVDSDDWLEREFVEYMLNLENQTGADVVISPTVFGMNRGKDDAVEIWTPETATTKIFYPELPIGVWNKMWRRDFIIQHNLRFIPELYTGEGLCFMSFALPRANKIGVGRRGLYHYRVNNPQSATTKPDIKQPIGALHTLEVIKENMILKSDKVNRAIQYHVWANHFWTILTIFALAARGEHEELYKKSVRYLRKHIGDVFRADVSLRHKLRAFCISLLPFTMARIVNYRNSKSKLKGNNE